MSKTDTDLAREVLREIAILDAVEEANAEDDAFVKSQSVVLHELLAQKKIANWQPDDIPENVFRHLVRYVAFFCGPAFGIKFDPNEELIRENSLRRVTALPYSGSQQKNEYF